MPATLDPASMLAPEKLLELSEKHDGCLHVIRTTDHKLLIQLYPLSDGEPPIAQSATARFEMVFRPPTGREVIIFKKRSKTAAADTADTDFFKGCVVHPAAPETVAAILERWALLFATPKLVRAMMALGGGDIEEEGKG